MCQTLICVPTLPLLSAPAHTGDSPRTRLHCASLESSDATVANGRAFKGRGLGPCTRYTCTNAVMAVSLLSC